MKFHEKLNLLMNMQKIANNKLAKVLSVDPSLISRWRNGSREIAHSSDYLKHISNYVATHAYDYESLYEILDISTTYDIRPEDLSEKVRLWLCDAYSVDIAIVNAIILKLNQSPQKPAYVKPIKKPLLVDSDCPAFPSLAVDVYLGTEGKKQSVLRFLNRVIEHEEPLTLLLYSDEPMEWLSEDTEFSLNWSKLLTETIAKGHKIKIIHTVNRSLQELLLAIEKWLPVYMTGSVIPYYLPIPQDSYFKRTLFIAPGLCAVSSNAIIGATDYEQLYYEDIKMVEILENEYNLFLKHCRPLMKIFSRHELEPFTQILEELERQKGDVAVFSQSPAFSLLPREILEKSIQSNTEISSQEFTKLLNAYDKRRFSFNANLASYSYCEWFPLPDLETIDTTYFESSHPCDCFLDIPLKLNFTDYVAHLENVYHTLKTNHRFHAILTNDVIVPENILVIVKKSKGVIVCKMNAPEIYIAINHPMMIQAFQKFIEESASGYLKDNHSRSLMIKSLESWLSAAKMHPLYEA